MAVGGEGMDWTTWLTVASLRAKTASMICRSRRLRAGGLDMFIGSGRQFWFDR